MKQQATDFNPVSASTYVEMIELGFDTRITTMCFGPSGHGKSSIPVKWARSKGVRSMVLNFSDKGPQEATGYGIPDHETREMWFSDPTDLPTRRRVGEEDVLCILDELPNWDPQLGAAFHSSLSAPEGMPRYIGSHEVGPNVRFLATGNLRRHGAKVVKITIPQVARCVMVSLLTEPSEWVDWAEEEGYADTFVPAFIEHYASLGDEGSSLIFTDPGTFDPYEPQPYACPRSWHTAAKILLNEVSGSMVPLTAARRIACRGAWGDRVQRAYEGFLQLIHHAEGIGAVREGAAPPPEPDKQYALVAACLSQLTKGLPDPEMETHRGTFDWFGDLLGKCRGDIARYGARSALRRGVALDHHPKYQHLTRL
jgi:hypothetical protein